MIGQLFTTTFTHSDHSRENVHVGFGPTIIMKAMALVSRGWKYGFNLTCVSHMPGMMNLHEPCGYTCPCSSSMEVLRAARKGPAYSEKARSN